MKILIGLNSKVLKVLILSLVPFLSGSFMMFLPTMSMVDDKTPSKTDPGVKTAISKLIKESAEELTDNRGQYAQILLGEVKVVGNFVSADKVRMLLLEALREKKELDIPIRSDSSTDAHKDTDVENSSPLFAKALLNAQFYNSEGQIWQAQQLVDMRSNRLIWSGIHSVPLHSSV